MAVGTLPLGSPGADDRLPRGGLRDELLCPRDGSGGGVPRRRPGYRGRGPPGRGMPRERAPSGGRPAHPRTPRPRVCGDARLLAMLEQEFGRRATWTEPSNVVDLVEGAVLRLAGLEVAVAHAPGHTEGSVMFTVPDLPSQLGASSGLSATCLSGDVLFAGSIGRTDLAGGSGEAMTRSLRDVVLPMADDTLVLPGHGPSTTIGRERDTN